MIINDGEGRQFSAEDIPLSSAREVDGSNTEALADRHKENLEAMKRAKALVDEAAKALADCEIGEAALQAVYSAGRVPKAVRQIHALYDAFLISDTVNVIPPGPISAAGWPGATSSSAIMPSWQHVMHHSYAQHTISNHT